MKADTIGGAAIAALIGFLTGFLALLQQEGVSNVNEISQTAWIVLGVGALIAFFKDYQAISSRRLIARLSGSPGPALMLVGCLLLLPGCANLSNGIGAAYISIESMAQTITAECGNTVPGGECTADSLLTRSDVDGFKEDLQEAKMAVDSANVIYNTGNASGAANELQVAQNVLATIRSILTSKGVE